jgi:hypothetical protein
MNHARAVYFFFRDQPIQNGTARMWLHLCVLNYETTWYWSGCLLSGECDRSQMNRD